MRERRLMASTASLDARRLDARVLRANRATGCTDWSNAEGKLLDSSAINWSPLRIRLERDRAIASTIHP